MNECSFDYICPVVCTGRSKDCHATCERFKRFRELREAERQKLYFEAQTDPIVLRSARIKQERRFPKNRF